MKLLISWIISVLFVFSCTKKNKNEYGLDISETLRINIETEPPSLDWNKASDTTSSLMLNNLMDHLVEYDFSGEEMKLKPALATEWIPEKNNQVWTLKLRKDVKWTDGVDFTAQQVVDGWERLLNANTASQYSYYLFGLKNAKEYNEGKVKSFSEVGVKVTEDGHLRVELTSPMAYFPHLLTHTSTLPLRKDIVEKFGDRWTEAENIVTLGPYRLKIWDHDKSVVLERSESYYGEKAKIKYILGYMINEHSTALNLFNAGKIDALITLPSTEIRELRKRPEFKDIGILTMYYYGLNTKKAPLDNPLVRKALSHAIDRKEITQMLDGGQIPLTSWVPTGMFGHEPDIGNRFNPDLAKKLLDQAGFKNRSKLPKIEIGINTNEDHKRIAENVQAQLKRNLGIDVEINNEEWKVYLERLRTNPPHIYRFGWAADFPDPDNFLGLMTSYSNNNHTGWGNKKFDSLIEKAVGLDTLEKRKAIYAEAQKIMVEDDVPVIPIYSYVSQFLISNRVQNFPINSMRKFRLYEVSLK